MPNSRKVRRMGSGKVNISESTKLKVAAYCRVSTDHDEQDLSLDAQVNYYTKLIANNPEWRFAGIYAERVSGTGRECRGEFDRMMADCRGEKFDYIITKSIGRFGRNTLPFLQSIGELSERGIAVHFETENINSSDPGIREALTIYAAIAQADSESKSEDIKWGIRKRMLAGKPMLNHTRFLGYTKDKSGNLIVVAEEAKVVQIIFDLYLQGNGVRKIKKYLESNGIKTVTEKTAWSTSTIDRMLSNEKYIGDALLQKTITEDCLTGKRVKNIGQAERYYVENSHEAIISREMFEKVQRKKRGEMM